jgi:hypothetical protein
MRSNAAALWLVSALVLCTPSTFAQANSTSVQLISGSVLKLESKGDALRASLSQKTSKGAAMKSPVVVSNAINKAVRDATEILGVGSRAFASDGRTLFVLAVATPSVHRSGLGFCGAGTEDKLLLIEWRAKQGKLVLLDQLQIQSCLRSIALKSDAGNDLVTLLGGVKDPAQIRLTWLAHPTYQQATKTVTSQLDKFVVAE